MVGRGSDEGRSRPRPRPKPRPSREGRRDHDDDMVTPPVADAMPGRGRGPPAQSEVLPWSCSPLVKGYSLPPIDASIFPSQHVSFFLLKKLEFNMHSVPLTLALVKPCCKQPAGTKFPVLVSVFKLDTIHQKRLDAVFKSIQSS